MVSPFENSRAHVYAELARLDLLIQREVWRWRQANASQSPAGDEFRGLYVSETEVDAILDGVFPGSSEVTRRAADQPTEGAFRLSIERAAAEIDRRKAASVEQGIPLRLEQLRVQCGLAPFDLDALLIGLAPETELRYERLYAYLQDDVTRKRPSVALVLNLLCATPDRRVSARARFSPGAPLLSHQLVTLFGDPAQPHSPLLALYIKPDRRIVEFLLRNGSSGEHGALDARLRRFCDLSHPMTRPETLLASETKAQLAHLIAQPPDPQDSPSATLVLLCGEDGTGRYLAAQAVSAAWGQPLLTVHLARVVNQSDNWKQTTRLIAREAYLTGAALYWRDYDLLYPPRESEGPEHLLRRETLHDALVEYPVPSFLPVQAVDRQPDHALLCAPRLARVTFPRPSYTLRRDLWRRRLEGHSTATDLDLPAVAGRFRLSNRQIHDAALDASHRAAQRPPGQQAIGTDDIFAAARACTSSQLAELARKIVPRHTWADLVLPDDQTVQLHEMCDQMRYRPIVFGEWGFDRKLSLGKGLNALFAGPSGTGKTMAAEVIAGGLGLDLYKIDLSTVVSKYIGETEKNMERIFRSARNSNAILFFDEADALFGKRSEVRDAHDRYANVEISYLLQKMEEYDGLVILTTNLNKNMDEAFARRMHFTVEFPFPEKESRQRIWEITFPDETPVASNVDYDLLAERYRLTGGNIRNVVLTAAFLAARDGGVVSMDHLLWATRREYQKMGRLVDERDFAPG